MPTDKATPTELADADLDDVNGGFTLTSVTDAAAASLNAASVTSAAGSGGPTPKPEPSALDILKEATPVGGTSNMQKAKHDAAMATIRNVW